MPDLTQDAYWDQVKFDSPLIIAESGFSAAKQNKVDVGSADYIE
jgi:hypothetical protein